MVLVKKIMQRPRNIPRKIIGILLNRAVLHSWKRKADQTFLQLLVESCRSIDFKSAQKSSLGHSTEYIAATLIVQHSMATYICMLASYLTCLLRLHTKQRAKQVGSLRDGHYELQASSSRCLPMWYIYTQWALFATQATFQATQMTMHCIKSPTQNYYSRKIIGDIYNYLNDGVMRLIT